MEPWMLALIKDLGIPLGLVVIFVMDGRKREIRMGNRLDKVTDGALNKLSEVVEKNTAAMDRCTRQQERNNRQDSSDEVGRERHAHDGECAEVRS